MLHPELEIFPKKGSVCMYLFILEVPGSPNGGGSFLELELKLTVYNKLERLPSIFLCLTRQTH